MLGNPANVIQNMGANMKFSTQWLNAKAGLAALLLAGCFAFASARAQEDSQPGAGDDPLAEDSEAPAKVPAPPVQPEAPQASEKPGELDDLLEGLDEPVEGEDVALEDAGNSPFSKISRTMRRAERLIARAEGEQTAPLHEEIVQDLDALIAKMQKQCEACKGGGKPKPGGKGSKPGNGKTGGGGGGPSKGGPAKDSTSKTRDMKSESVDRAAGQLQLIKALWGGLPEREQLEKLRQFQEEEFVPEFELLTEEYFKALTGAPAEQP